jgi:hypothetical protein
MQGKQMMAQGLSSAIGGIAGGMQSNMQHKQLLAALK